MSPKNNDSVGQLLIKAGLISEQQLVLALKEQEKSEQLLGDVLTRMGFVDEEYIMLPVLAWQMGVPFVLFKNVLVDPEALARLPAKAANHYKVFPVKLADGLLHVAMRNPRDVHVLDELGLIAHMGIQPVLAAEKEIQGAIREHYGVGAETIEKMMTGIDVELQVAPVVENIDERSSEASISQFLNQILHQAYKDKATDVHIEPFEDELRIRYRIDGVLYDANVPGNIRFFQDALMSRIKIMSNLNIAEKRLPQDGRFKVKMKELDLDLRVSFLPTSYGESCVIRILNSVKLHSFEDLGIVGQERRNIDKLLTKPHGIIFMTGPTGSGKTTTLYTCLSQVNKENNKIITVEDPVEYQLRGVVQIQVHPQIGLNFSAALRTMLRHDPDIIMVGEVRDLETAQISIQMALTGHLVFSTLHTNDAASGITRLLDMGIEPYLIASSVECLIAQRLVRLLCLQCRVRVDLTPEVTREFGLKEAERNVEIFEGKGCKACRMTGYVGRQAICEFLTFNEQVRTMIVRRATAGEIKEQAVKTGMKTLRRQGWEKIMAGITSPSEVLRVTHEDN